MKMLIQKAHAWLINSLILLAALTLTLSPRAETVSGVQNLAGTSHQGKQLANLLMHQAKLTSCTMGVSGCLDVAKNAVDPKRTKHIFRDKKGHLSDTPENRKLLEGVADNPKTTLGNDKFGNTWSAQNRSDGSQVWTQTRDGKIINGGVNQTPRSFDPKTGLSAPAKPRQ